VSRGRAQVKRVESHDVAEGSKGGCQQAPHRRLKRSRVLNVDFPPMIFVAVHLLVADPNQKRRREDKVEDGNLMDAEYGVWTRY